MNLDGKYIIIGKKHIDEFVATLYREGYVWKDGVPNIRDYRRITKKEVFPEQICLFFDSKDMDWCKSGFEQIIINCGYKKKK